MLRYALPIAKPLACTAVARGWFGLSSWLSPRRPRRPRLDLAELSGDRLRDLGLIDGRGTPPRNPLWD
jgi:hypothetical protein